MVENIVRKSIFAFVLCLQTFVTLQIVPDDEDVRYTDGRPTAQKKRDQREAGFIDKYDDPAVVTRLFLYAAICTVTNVRWLVGNIVSTA